MRLPGLELIIELTGNYRVLEEVYEHQPMGVRVMDHVLARVFWDLERVTETLRAELREKTALENRIARDRSELQEILDTIPDLLMVLDRERKIRRINRRVEAITGSSREDVRGLLCEEVFCGSDEAEYSAWFCDVFDRVIGSGEPVTLLHSGKNTKGQDVHLEITANPILDGDGRISRVVQTSREITEVVRLQRETEESARRFRQILNAAHGIITIKDLEGRYQLVNPRAEQVFGIARNLMLGRTATDLFPGETAATIAENDRKALDKGGHYTSEEQLMVGGRIREMVTERFPLTDYKGEVVGLCSVSRDYSRRRQLQRELIRTERLAAVGKLAAGVAHELNNPLSGIIAFAEDLKEEAPQDDPAKGDYEIIFNEAMRCRRIVRNLLEFSRQKAPERKTIRLNNVVKRVLPIVEKQASFHNIDFDAALADGLPEVDADPHQIQQALLNLVINARDAMEGTGTISISTALENDGRSLILSVTDNGCGIPEENLGEIFEPFFSTKGEQGNGLGLPAVLRVVEQHGGRVEVDSKVGVGTTFRILLPTTAE
jgi:PAS domain S-box-containing protein